MISIFDMALVNIKDTKNIFSQDDFMQKIVIL